jgi:hypothetical protein
LYLHPQTLKRMRKVNVFFLGLLMCTGWEAKAQYVKLVTSNLPIVVINTDNIVIPDDPKIHAHMGIIWHEEKQDNRITDPFTHYDGNIAIEVRGSSSQMFPKKSYSFELRDAVWADQDASLLGVPEEEDWILYGPYSDKTLIRNVLTFTLDGALGHYSPRCRYVELVINDEYKGIYVLMEKIKRDKHRVDLAKLKTEDTEGKELTGGYIIKIDKLTGSGGSGFYSSFTNKKGSYTYFQYEYPKEEEIQPEQQTYIRDYVSAFEEALYENDFSYETGYRTYIDVTSFVDYLLMSEVSKNVDAYRLSTFMYKDKNERLNLGPLWDINLGYGNADYYNAWSEYGFQFASELGDDQWEIPFWWQEMRKDPYFCLRVTERWQELRDQALSHDRIFFVIDSLTERIASARARNFQQWNIINRYVWPNYYIGPSYEAEVTWMKSWISKRLNWLDINIPVWFSGENYDPGTLKWNVMAGPNPVSEKDNELNFFIESPFGGTATVQFFSTSGTLVFSEEINLEAGMIRWSFTKVPELAPGIYVYRILRTGNVLSQGKIVKINGF